jgi:ABC-type uncharacterized transport system YnjBCD permease subunit
MDELDWAAYRRRVRTRTSCQMLLIIAPFMALIAILKIVAPMDYSAGDIRNSIEFRLLFYGLFIAFAVGMMVAAARWLRADRRG